MNPAVTPPGSRRHFLAGLGLGLLGVSGCRLGRSSTPQRTFVLRAPDAGPAPGRGPGEGAAPAGGVLLVRPFRVNPVFDSRAFVIRRGESEYTADPYNAFLGAPGPLVTEAVAAWVRGLGVFGTVTTGGSQLVASHALEGEVTELYGDYRDPARPQAVLGLQLRLLHPLAGPGAGLRWQREARREAPMAQAAAEELVAGWNQALAGICASLDPALFQRMPPSAQPQASRGLRRPA